MSLNLPHSPFSSPTTSGYAVSTKIPSRTLHLHSASPILIARRITLIHLHFSAPLLPNILPHFQTLTNFVVNTLPKPVLIALLYRLTILHLASRILPTIGADSWDSEEGVDNGWDDRPVSAGLSTNRESKTDDPTYNVMYRLRP